VSPWLSLLFYEVIGICLFVAVVAACAQISEWRKNGAEALCSAGCGGDRETRSGMCCRCWTEVHREIDAAINPWPALEEFDEC
jgi:hypothetical protein